MEGLLVGLDVLGHHSQARALCSLAELFGLLPQLRVAACAIDLLQSQCRVLDVGVGLVGVVCNVGVASHALHVGVHALGKLVSSDAAQGARLAVGSGNFELALLAVMAGQTGGVIK